MLASVFEEAYLRGLVAEEVDEGAVALLVGEPRGGVAGLVEGFDYAL